MSEHRIKPFSNYRLAHPAVPIALFIFILSAVGSGFSIGNGMENRIMQTEGAIEHEVDIRILTTEQIKEDILDLKQAVVKIQEQMVQDNKEVTGLLREIIQSQ